MLKGFTQKTTEKKIVHICPECSAEYLSIWMKDDQPFCTQCQKKISQESLIIKEKKLPAYQCAECGNLVSICQSNHNWAIQDSYICCECRNVVAIRYRKRIWHPAEILTPEWNIKMGTEVKEIDKDRSCLVCRSKKDFYVLRLLQLMAKEEYPVFLFFKRELQKACLLFDRQKNIYLGYLIWSEEKGEKTLQQLFIDEKHRRKGHAQTLISFWITHILNGADETICINHPNEKSYPLLEKLTDFQFEYRL